MKPIEEICKKYHIGICYLFGSQKEIGKAVLDGKKIKVLDETSDIDFGVLFWILPKNPLETYVNLSLEFQETVSLFKADLLFLHEVGHLSNLRS